MTYNDFWRPLTKVYAADEAKAVARMVLELRFGLSFADVLSGAVERLDSADTQELDSLRQRLLRGEPVQYVLGEAEFCGRRFVVSPAVLIPRPETAELCRMMVSQRPQLPQSSLHILDVGTGSGCIAVTLALDMRDVHVTAWDISEAALEVARTNVARLGAEVELFRQDALSPPDDNEVWDIIVSNPPYICRQEYASMPYNVKAFEPETALFVPDDDPLRFYRSIASYARNALKPGGWLCLEVNPLYAEEIRLLLCRLGFEAVAISNDQFGRIRFVCSHKPERE